MKAYSEAERAPLLKQLKRLDPTTVSKASGVSVDSLKRWAVAAGIPVIDGRRKGRRQPTAKAASPAGTLQRKASVKTPPPLANGHHRASVTPSGITVDLQDGLQITLHGLGDFLRQCVREERQSIREELGEAARTVMSTLRGMKH